MYLRKLLVSLMVITLTACGTNTPVTISDYCQLYKPIYDSKKDTKETRTQVLLNNSTYECICNSTCPN